MRHSNANRTLNRDTDQRRALLRSLAVNMIAHKQISTTLPKAKELQPFIERLVTAAKTDSVAARRKVSAELANQSAAVTELFSKISPKFSARMGGYTRIVKTGIRQSDSAAMAIIEFVD